MDRPRSDIRVVRLRVVLALTWGLAFATIGATELWTLPHARHIEHSGDLIDRAGRQRMLSQRGVLLLEIQHRPAEELDLVVHDLRAGHESIRSWLEEHHHDNHDDLARLTHEVDRHLRPLIIALEMRSSELALEHAEPFLHAMDQVVTWLSDHADDTLAEVSAQIRLAAWCLAIAIASVALLALAPAIRRIRRQLRDLDDQRRTALAQAEEIARRRQHLETVFEVSRDPLFLIDEVGTILAVSPSVADSFGYTPDELVGRPIETPQCEPHRSRHRAYLERARQRSSGPSQFYELVHEVDALHRDGSVIPCQLKVGRALSGDGPQFVGILRDIREERARELTFAEQHQVLDEARREAECANRAKGEFLANISHEIRTPMTAMIGLLDLIREALPEDDHTTRRLVDRAEVRGRHLVELITDLLDYSRMESGKIDLVVEDFDPVFLVESLSQEFGQAARTKGLTLEIDIDEGVPTRIASDRHRLKQVVAQLLDNAIKFTDRGTVGLRIGAEPFDGRPGIAISVLDTGRGLDPEGAERIFDAFRQGDGTLTRKHGGIGIGLSIARRLAELLQGRLTLRSSTPGEGSEFALQIPVRVEEAQRNEKKRSSSGAGPLHDRRVLIVEDTSDSRRLFVKVLERGGATVTEAENGALALDAVENAPEPFDLIIMDIQMPVMDGLLATQTLRERGVRVPIAALTAHATSGEEERCLGAGCDQFWNKPITPSDLLEKTRSAIEDGVATA